MLYFKKLRRLEREFAEWRCTSPFSFINKECAMHSKSQFQMLRWFLLCWIGLIVILSLFPRNFDTGEPQPAVPPTCVLQRPNLFACRITPGDYFGPISITPQWVVFLALAIVYGLIVWVTLSGRLPQRITWLVLLLLVGLVFVEGLLVSQQNITLNLYLSLLLIAISVHQRIWESLAVAGVLLLLFALDRFLVEGGWSFLVTLLTNTNYAALLLFAGGYLMLSIQQARVHRELAMAHTELKDAHIQLEDNAARIEDLTLINERQRLARELHDTLAQGLVGLAMQLETVDLLLERRRYDQARIYVQQSMTRTRATLTQARSAIDDLRTSESSKRDLARDIQTELQRFSNTTGLLTTCDLASLPTLPEMYHEQIVRLLAETLTNIERHAYATHVYVCATYEQGTLTLEIQDNGIGFEPAGVEQDHGHYGLLGMRERAHLMYGELAIHSKPGAGTRVCLRVREQQVAEEESSCG
jgi:NarL family two-component system sensor histidine kinase YdfH